MEVITGRRVLELERGLGAVSLGRDSFSGVLEARLGIRGVEVRLGAAWFRFELRGRGEEIGVVFREVDRDETPRLGRDGAPRVGLVELETREVGRLVVRLFGRLVVRLVGRWLVRGDFVGLEVDLVVTPRLERLGAIRVGLDPLELRVAGRLTDRPLPLDDLEELLRDEDERARTRVVVVERLAGADRRAEERLGRSFAWAKGAANKSGRQRSTAFRRFDFVDLWCFRK